MIRKTLIQHYGLDPTKTWNVIDRFKGLCLLDGFYAGMICSLDSDLRIDWLPRHWQVRRLAESLLGEKEPSKSEEDTYQPLRSNDSIIAPMSPGRYVHSGTILQKFPEGPIIRLWQYQDQVLVSSRNKINDQELKGYVIDKPATDNPQYFLISVPDLTLTQRKAFEGVFSLRELPKLSIIEANDWMGFDRPFPWQFSDGESVLATEPSGKTYVIKPHCQIWRESLVLGESYPDMVLIGNVRKRLVTLGGCAANDLYCRFIELTMVASLDDDEYLQFWPLVIPTIREPYQKLTNMYYCFLRALASSQTSGLDFYQRWFGTEPGQDFVSETQSLGEDDLPESDLEKLILKLWPAIKGNYRLPKKLSILRKNVYGNLGSPWDNWRDLFLYQNNSLNGLEISSLRRYGHSE